MRIETFYKVLLGIIVVVAIIGQIKDNVVSKNEIEKCYKENYTFVYKQETLSDNLIKQFLSQLNEYNYSEEKDKKDSDEYQFVDSIFIPERKIVLQVNHKSKTVQIARIKSAQENTKMHRSYISMDIKSYMIRRSYQKKK